jgi:hypothetical protein
MDPVLMLGMAAIIALSGLAMTKLKPKWWLFKFLFAAIIVGFVNAFIRPFQPEEVMRLLINGVVVLLIGWNISTSKTKWSVITGITILILGVVLFVSGVLILADTPAGQMISDLLQFLGERMSIGWSDFLTLLKDVRGSS